MSADERVAIVTGASSGIGRATAIELAARGYRLSLSGRNEEALAAVVDECKRAGASRVLTTLGDLREAAVSKSLVERTLAELGRVDTLVNAAGILKSAPVVEAALRDYDAIFDVNVRR